MYIPALYFSFKHQVKRNLLFYLGLDKSQVNVVNTLPRSGWNTLSAVIRSAYCYEIGLPGKISYYNNRYLTVAGENLFGVLDERSLYKESTYYHTHRPLDKSALPLFSSKRIFALVREPLSFVRSFIQHWYRE